MLIDFPKKKSTFLSRTLYYGSDIIFLDLQSFITQDAGDRDFLAKNLKPFDVPILNYVSNESSRKEPFQISEEVPITDALI